MKDRGENRQAAGAAAKAQRAERSQHTTAINDAMAIIALINKFIVLLARRFAPASCPSA